MLLDVDGYRQDVLDSAVKREPVRKHIHTADICPLCDGAITRFDHDVFVAHGRCAPCHEALALPE